MKLSSQLSLSISSSILMENKMAVSVCAPKVLCWTKIFLLLLMASLSKAVLDAHYYDHTCPQAEKIILGTVYEASMQDPKVPPRILRMFFHDCFIRVSPRSICVF
jgi:peroxidase